MKTKTRKKTKQKKKNRRVNPFLEFVLSVAVVAVAAALTPWLKVASG